MRLHSVYLFLVGFGEPSSCTFDCGLLGFLGLRRFPISHAGKSFYDFGPRRWLLIRDNQLTLGAFVKVVILGPALRGHSEDKKQSKPNCEIQSCTSSSGFCGVEARKPRRSDTI